MFKSRERTKRFELSDDHRRAIAHAKVEKKKDKKISSRRKIMLAVLVAFFLAIIEIFVAKHFRPSDNTPPDIEQHPESYGEAFTTFGEEAVPFQQLTEMTDAHLTNLEGLSEGSKAAQQRQKDYCTQFKMPLEVRNSIGMQFRLIPPGKFTMGSPDDEEGRGFQLPSEDYHVEEQHEVDIFYPIYIGKFEVTQEQYRRITGESPSIYVGKNRPVEEITQIQARAFCNQLSEHEGLPRGTYRMLSEEEWEYSCRAGTKTAFYFSNMDDIAEFMHYGEGNGGQTEVIGKRRPNAFGLFNMHGNVHEWCKDFYKSYYAERLAKADVNQRVIRGGSWYHQLPECRAANRSRLGDRSPGNMLGFRVARSISKEWKKLQRTREFRKSAPPVEPVLEDELIEEDELKDE